MKNILVKICCALVFSSTPAQAQLNASTVVRVSDGDTLLLGKAGQMITVRMGCIDAPERTQSPWGQQSTSRLKQILPSGTVVQIRHITRDRYGRSVAELFIGDKSVNLQMVAEGQAVVYPQYLSGCSLAKNQYLQAETQAKKQSIGFWNQELPIMPWIHRQLKLKRQTPPN